MQYNKCIRAHYNTLLTTQKHKGPVSSLLRGWGTRIHAQHLSHSVPQTYPIQARILSCPSTPVPKPMDELRITTARHRRTISTSQDAASQHNSHQAMLPRPSEPTAPSQGTCTLTGIRATSSLLSRVLALLQPSGSRPTPQGLWKVDSSRERSTSGGLFLPRTRVTAGLLGLKYLQCPHQLTPKTPWKHQYSRCTPAGTQRGAVSDSGTITNQCGLQTLPRLLCS